MDVFTMVVLIVAFGTTASVIQHWLKVRGQAYAQDNAASTALQTKVADLEKRIRVLERIATDKTNRLSEEIDAL